MNNLDPTHYNAKQLEALGPHALHHLAVRSCGTLAAYRLLLGRCLLAIQRSDLHYEHGCSSAIHYAMRVLGMARKDALTLRRVARQLEELPRLSLQASGGTIEWSKLREVVRVASEETESVWIELCARHTYSEIERLVALTPYGQLPGEAKASRNPVDLVDLRCVLSPEAMVIVERGLQSLSQEAGKVVALAEGIEFVFAEYLARRPLDERLLEKARSAAQEDLAAEETRDQALLQKCPVRVLQWMDTVNAQAESLPANPEVKLVTREPRVPSARMRRDLLRRDGYCCATPGCPNHLYLETHHVVFYCFGGKTVPWNMVVLCSRCHKNVHEGHLRIEGRAPDGLRFLDRMGRDLSRQHQLDWAHWLDCWLGWRGGESETHLQRARAA